MINIQTTGQRGAKGDQGDAGNDGAQGDQGIQGTPGADGADGVDGFSVDPIMLDCLVRSASTIVGSQAHDGTHKVAYNSTPAVGSLPSWLTVSGDGMTLTLKTDGIYSFSHNTYVQVTTGQRAGPTARFAVGGTVEGARPATGYIRTSAGHNESSSHIAEHLIERSGSDKAITVTLGNECTVAATNASMAAGESTLTIKKLT